MAHPDGQAPRVRPRLLEGQRERGRLRRRDSVAARARQAGRLHLGASRRHVGQAPGQPGRSRSTSSAASTMPSALCRCSPRCTSARSPSTIATACSRCARPRANPCALPRHDAAHVVGRRAAQDRRRVTVGGAAAAGRRRAARTRRLDRRPTVTDLPDGLARPARSRRRRPASPHRLLLDTCETADTGAPCVHEMDLAVESRSPQLRPRRTTPGWCAAPTATRRSARLDLDAASRRRGSHGRPLRSPRPSRARGSTQLFLDVIEARAARCSPPGGRPSRAVRRRRFSPPAEPTCGHAASARPDRCSTMRLDIERGAARRVEVPAGIVVRPSGPGPR